MRQLTIIFFSTWKFAATFPLAIYVMKMSVTETLIYTNIGGILGTFVFIYFSHFLIKLCDYLLYQKFNLHKKSKRIFTKANRLFVKIKSKYGLLGIAGLSPVILSIPIGSFLAVKYYGIKKINILKLITGQVIWSLLYCLFYFKLKLIF